MSSRRQLGSARCNGSEHRIYTAYTSIPREVVCEKWGALVAGPDPTSWTRRARPTSLWAMIGNQFLLGLSSQAELVNLRPFSSRRQSGSLALPPDGVWFLGITAKHAPKPN